MLFGAFQGGVHLLHLGEDFLLVVLQFRTEPGQEITELKLFLGAGRNIVVIERLHDDNPVAFLVGFNFLGEPIRLLDRLPLGGAGADRGYGLRRKRPRDFLYFYIIRDFGTDRLVLLGLRSQSGTLFGPDVV